MEPYTVLKASIKAVPSLKYALAVCGVIAAAMIIYNLTSNDPRKAFIAFIFTLAGMILLAIFAQAAANSQNYQGPIIVLTWAVTIFFIIALTLSLTGFAFGWPVTVAELLKTTPGSARTAATTVLESSANTVLAAKPLSPATKGTDDKAVIIGKTPEVTPLPPTPAVIPVVETFRISDSDEDCSADRSKTVEYCISSPATIVNWSGPNIETGNCGSSITNIKIVDAKPNCISADVRVRGCGYDNFGIVRNCRGRGWVGATIVINGQRIGS